MTYPITLNVNGVAVPGRRRPHKSLLDTVRDQLGLTGSKEGCDDSECGACMMLVDGRPTNACSYLAIQADGASITTVEGLGDGDDLSPLQPPSSRRAACSAGSARPAC